MSDRLAVAAPSRPAREAVPEVAPPPPDWLHGSMRGLARLVFRGYFGLEHIGRRNIPRQGPALVVSNHPSYVDPWLVGLGIPSWVTWLAWDDAFAWKGAGLVIRLSGALPLNLDRPRPSTLKAAYQVLEQGRFLGLFFEGQRSLGLTLDTPKRGAARMALQAGVPILPVSISGMRRLWPRDGLPRPGRVLVHYHPPIDAASYLKGRPLREREQALTDDLIARIRSVLPPDGRPNRRPLTPRA